MNYKMALTIAGAVLTCVEVVLGSIEKAKQNRKEHVMTDYKALYYKSQAQLADIADKLKQIVLDIQQNMRDSEEIVISSESDENQGGDAS